MDGSGSAEPVDPDGRRGAVGGGDPTDLPFAAPHVTAGHGDTVIVEVKSGRRTEHVVPRTHAGIAVYHVRGPGLPQAHVDDFSAIRGRLTGAIRDQAVSNLDADDSVSGRERHGCEADESRSRLANIGANVESAVTTEFESIRTLDHVVVLATVEISQRLSGHHTFGEGTVPPPPIP
jgi:hypothetical protein